jgi:hypothetical protein
MFTLEVLFEIFNEVMSNQENVFFFKLDRRVVDSIEI